MFLRLILALSMLITFQVKAFALETVKSYGELSPGAIELAQLLGIDNNLRELEVQSQKPDRDRLSLMFLKQNIVESTLTQSMEIRSVISKLEHEIAQADDLQALLEEKRDRAVRLNTIANFVSGGITGIVGGALNLGDVNIKADNTLELSDGIVQTSLAALAYKQQDGEHRLMRGVPNMLAGIFALREPADYPPNVWKFLNQDCPNEKGKTRRQALVSRWQSLGLINRRAKDRIVEQERIKVIAGANQAKVSIDLLDARSAMLHDVKATIAEQDSYLLEILQLVSSVKI